MLKAVLKLDFLFPFIGGVWCLMAAAKYLAIWIGRLVNQEYKLFDKGSWLVIGALLFLLVLGFILVRIALHNFLKSVRAK